MTIDGNAKLLDDRATRTLFGGAPGRIIPTARPASSRPSRYDKPERGHGDPKYYMAVDLGQRRDYTASALIEAKKHYDRENPIQKTDGVWTFPRLPSTYDIVHLDRAPLGTHYTDIVDTICTTLDTPKFRGKTLLVVDGTGVGVAVTEMFMRRSDAPLIVEATITAGERNRIGRTKAKIAKKNLLDQMRILLEQDRVRIAAGLPYVETLLNEVETFQVRVSAAGNERVGAWREGEHDDLVFATALGLFMAEYDDYVTRRQDRAANHRPRLGDPPVPSVQPVAK